MEDKKVKSYMLKKIDADFWEKVRLLAKIQRRTIKGTLLQLLAEAFIKYGV